MKPDQKLFVHMLANTETKKWVNKLSLTTNKRKIHEVLQHIYIEAYSKGVGDMTKGLLELAEAKERMENEDKPE